MADPLYMAPGPAEGLITPGNIDLTQLPAVNLGGKNWGTVRSASREVNGQEVLYPTIVNGKPVSDDDAFQYAMKTGKHLGIFKDGDSADAYAQRLHSDWEAGKIPGVKMPDDQTQPDQSTTPPITTIGATSPQAGLQFFKDPSGGPGAAELGKFLKIHNPLPQDKDISDELRGQAYINLYPKSNWQQIVAQYQKQNPNWNETPDWDRAVELGRSILPPVVGAVVGGVSSPFITPMGGTALGLGTNIALNNVLQAIQSRRPTSFTQGAVGASPNTLLGQTATSAQDALINEAGSRLIFDPAMRAINALRTPITNLLSPAAAAARANLQNIRLSTSQMYKALTGDSAPLSKFLEDVFSRTRKIKLQEEAARQASTDAKTIASKLSGQTGSVLDDPNAWADQIKNTVESQLQTFKNQSGLQADIVKTVANNVPDAVYPEIKGPIHLGQSVQEIQNILAELEKRKATRNIPYTPGDNPLEDLAHRILSEAQDPPPPPGPQLFGPNGQPIPQPPPPPPTYNRPISFDDAWRFKQMASQDGNYDQMGKPGIQLPSDSSYFFRQVTNALNDDIDASIGKWNHPDAAYARNAWNNAKAIVGEREALFNTKGDSIPELIRTAQTNLPHVDKIIDDSKQLERAINLGDVTFPTGVRSSTNLKGDLGGYNFARMWRNAEQTPDGDVSRLNVSRFWDQWNNPKFKASKDLLYTPQQQGQVEDFVKAIGLTQDRLDRTWRNPMFYMVHGAAMAGPALMRGQLLHLGNVLYTGGLELGLHQIGKLLIDKPETAELMVKLASGAPLGMSEQAAGRMIMGTLQGGKAILGGRRSGTPPAMADIGKDGMITMSDDQAIP